MFKENTFFQIDLYFLGGQYWFTFLRAKLESYSTTHQMEISLMKVIKNEKWQLYRFLIGIKKFMSMMLVWNLAIFAKLFLYVVHYKNIFKIVLNFFLIYIYTVIICYSIIYNFNIHYYNIKSYQTSVIRTVLISALLCHW